MGETPAYSVDSALPIRRIDLETESPGEIEQLQPERNRSIIQLQSGRPRFRMREFGWGKAAIQAEGWARGIRVLQNRPTSYVAYAFVTRGSARWMGVPIGPGSILRIQGPWELVSQGEFEYVAFAISRAWLESVQERMKEPGWDGLPNGYRVEKRRDSVLIAMRLLDNLDVLQRRAVVRSTLDGIGEELLRLALCLDRPDRPTPTERPGSSSSRLKVVRRVEDYLRAHDDAALSITTLCEIAGVCERTLDYAFREHLGVTPARYLKLRRLTQVRRQLQNPEVPTANVTEIAMRRGFYELGRFAGEYRQLFGELPSQTLAMSSRS